MKKLILILTALIFTTSGLLAQNTKTPKLNKKQKIQMQKIEQGVKSGELTRLEAKKLLKQEAKLNKFEKKIKSDGIITPKERAKLNNKVKKLDKKIFKEKNDRQVR
jgi:hypothetical protein